MTDDGGVLGNLPNSRPGKRSAKEGRRSAKPAAESLGRSGGPPDEPQLRKRMIPFRRPASEDPVGAVVRTATGVAVTGVKVAGAVGREFFKRLPRP